MGVGQMRLISRDMGGVVPVPYTAGQFVVWVCLYCSFEWMQHFTVAFPPFVL